MIFASIERLPSRICLALGACVVGVSCVSVGFGQVAITTRAASGDAVANGPHTLSLAIHPAAPTAPALQFELLRPEQDIEAGNAATRYLAALTLLPKSTDEDIDAVDDLLHVPLGQMDEKLASAKLEGAGSALHIMWTAARTERADWGGNVRREGVGALLPYLSPLRKLSNLLALAIRIDIKAHRWSEARDKLQTGFALARHLGEGGTLIDSLVGIGVAGRMESCLEDWVQEADAPNLFWPLSNLPSPFNEMRHPLSMERAIIYFQVPSMLDFAAGHYSADGWYRLTSDGLVLQTGWDNPTDPLKRSGLGLLMAVADYPQAQAALIARGARAEEVEKRPVAAVLEEFFMLRFSTVSDDVFKWNGLPADQAIAAWRDGSIDREAFAQEPKSFADFACRAIIPALGNARFNTARLDRRLEMLRIVEALRMAAAEKGTLPDSLEKTGLPLPSVDSATGKPFVYVRDAAGATLSSPATKDRGRDDEWHVSIHP